jgi:hypothetical protein
VGVEVWGDKWDDVIVMSPHPRYRTSRAVVFASVCVTLATLGHTVTSTVEVPLWAVAVGFGGVLAVTLALAGHERSLATILGGLLLGQFALHSLYAGASAPVEHHPALVSVDHGGSLAMTFAHVMAALLSAWWLRRGERAVWTAARGLATGRFTLLRVEPVAPHARTFEVPGDDADVSLGQALRRQVRRRGPPSRSRAL